MLFTTFYHELTPVITHALVPAGRLVGLFCLSPFFARLSCSLFVRIAFTVLCMFFMLPAVSIAFSWSLLLKELALGYTLGCLCAMLFEATALAGQLLGVLSGYTAYVWFEPTTSFSHPLCERFLIWTTCVLWIACDGHHALLRFLHQTFLALPTQAWGWPSMLDALIQTMHMLQAAFTLIVLPLTLLSALIVTLALATRFFTHVPLFWIMLPMQLLLGTALLIITLKTLPGWTQHMLHACLDTTRTLFFAL